MVIISILIYLLIGLILLGIAAKIEPFILAVWQVIPFFVLLWPYVLLRLSIDRIRGV